MGSVVTKWQTVRFFSEFFGFSMPTSFQFCCPLLYMGTCIDIMLYKANMQVLYYVIGVRQILGIITYVLNNSPVLSFSYLIAALSILSTRYSPSVISTVVVDKSSLCNISGHVLEHMPLGPAVTNKSKCVYAMKQYRDVATSKRPISVTILGNIQRVTFVKQV